VTLDARQFPRLLAGMESSGALGIAAHESLLGPLATPQLKGVRGGHPLIAEVERAGMRGYGGAGFPTGTKLDAVAAQRGPRLILVNATEGEPLSDKDELLMRHLPHQVIDGALVAAAVLGAEQIVFALDVHARTAHRSVDQALLERREFGQRNAPAVSLATAPSGYLSGQEMALVNYLNGGPVKPTATPPYPFERGLRGRPTLVSNAETFAQLGLVARYGAAWFRALGTETNPGTRLVTVGGGVRYPGVVEIAGGTSLRQVLNASGGVTEPLQGVLVGGYAGTWMGPDALDLNLDPTNLRQQGLALGSGIVFALPESACVVAEVASVARWLERSSAKQCGPCIHGLAAIADALADLTAEGDRRRAYGHIESWCELVNRRGACALPDGAASFVTTALRVFRPAFDDHARHGACDSCFNHRVMATTAPEGAVAA